MKINTLRKTTLAIAFFCLLLVGGYAEADVTIKMAVANPSAEIEQDVPVHYTLPPGLKKEDIVSSDGLAVDYDVNQGLYIVDGKVKLAPQESRTLKIVVKDVWKIPEDQIKNLLDILNEKINGVKDADRQEKAKIIGTTIS